MLSSAQLDYWIANYLLPHLLITESKAYWCFMLFFAPCCFFCTKNVLLMLSCNIGTTNCQKMHLFNSSWGQIWFTGCKYIEAWWVKKAMVCARTARDGRRNFLCGLCFSITTSSSLQRAWRNVYRRTRRKTQQCWWTCITRWYLYYWIQDIHWNYTMYYRI